MGSLLMLPGPRFPFACATKVLAVLVLLPVSAASVGVGTMLRISALKLDPAPRLTATATAQAILRTGSSRESRRRGRNSSGESGRDCIRITEKGLSKKT